MEKKANVHKGHRGRLRKSVDNNPELDALSDFEVLEYLTGFLLPQKDTNILAHGLIEKFGSLHNVFSASATDIFGVNGMTQLGANFLPCLLPLLKRAEFSRISRNITLSNVSEAINEIKPYFLAKNHEKTFILALDVNDRLMHVNCISKGDSGLKLADAAVIASMMSRLEACKVIIVRNRIGGKVMPSESDVQITASLMMLLAGMGKILTDHIIFSGDDYFSFYERDIITEILKSKDLVYGTASSKEVASRAFVNRYMLEKQNVHIAGLKYAIAAPDPEITSKIPSPVSPNLKYPK